MLQWIVAIIISIIIGGAITNLSNSVDNTKWHPVVKTFRHELEFAISIPPSFHRFNLAGSAGKQTFSLLST